MRTRFLLSDNSSSCLRLTKVSVWGVVNYVKVYFVIHEPSYNQNYNENYYPHNLPSFLCCDNCEDPHESFQCQSINQNFLKPNPSYELNSSSFDKYQPLQSFVTQQIPQRSNENIKLEMAKLIKNDRILLNNNIFPHEEASMEVLLAKERILKLIQAWDEKQIESWSFLELLHQLLNDLRTIDEMLKQREQAANLAVQKEQEEQAVQSFTPYWNFSMINDEEVLQSREKFMKAIQTFLQKFSRYSFGVVPKILLIAWERFFEIKHAFTDNQYQPEEIQELMCKLLEDVRIIREELAEYINSSSWNYPTFYDNDEEHYVENSSNVIAPVLPTKEPEYSLSMGEYEDTSDDESERDVPVKDESSPIFTTFSNPLFDCNDEFISSDDESFSNEDVPMEIFKIYSNPLFDDEEINSNEIDPHYFNAKYDLIESLTNHDTLFDSSPKFDYLKEFSGELMPTSIVNEELEDSDSLREEINIFTGTDDLIPPGIESDDYDSEGDIHFLEELLDNDSIPLPKNDSSNFDYHDDPSFPHPPLEPPDVEFFFDFEPNSGEVISAMMNNIDELIDDECFDPGGGEIDDFANVEDDDYFPFIFVI
nr:hypothetical protein [Tanacetum cinerariifolium]